MVDFGKMLNRLRGQKANQPVVEPTGEPSATLVDLVKKVNISLEKKPPLVTDKARVALCLDISLSMNTLYRTGKVDAFVRRILALGLRFDDDGEIDVFLFGAKGHEYGKLNASNYTTFTNDMRDVFELEGDTRYSDAVGLISDFYRNDGDTPIFVMCVTDGAPSDFGQFYKAFKAQSLGLAFWKFMGIGSRDMFSRIENELGNTFRSFTVDGPDSLSDEDLYDAILDGYSGWQAQAQAIGILK